MRTRSVKQFKKYEGTMRTRSHKKFDEGDADADSFSRLPDEIVLQIFNKLIDLKILCRCYLVSRRFSSIVLEVDAIAISAPLIPDVGEVFPSGELLPPFLCLYRSELYAFLSKFKGVKSLFIELPCSREIGILDHCLFKWKVKCRKGIESIMYLFPSSVRDKDGFIVNGGFDLNFDGEVDREVSIRVLNQYFDIWIHCLVNAKSWHMLLLELVKNLQKLEKVSITDSRRRGRVSLSGQKLIEVKEWLHSASETEIRMGRSGTANIVCKAYIPVLNLPVSGYMMKGIFFGAMKINPDENENDNDHHHHLINSNLGFEDEEEAVYTEALMEILEKHRDTILTYKPVPM